MRRYIDFRAEGWPERTDTHMQALRWEACLAGLGDEPPDAGVIDAMPQDMLLELLAEGWTAPVNMALQDADALREAAREALRLTLEDDVDCLSVDEHTLVERMLIGDGIAPLESVAAVEAAYTLRMRLWCDIGTQAGTPVARLDAMLMELLPHAMMRRQHGERRARIFIFEGMLHALLYISGYLDDRMPRSRFITEVLGAEASPENDRLARNFLEASYDTYPLAGCNLLIHEGLADPEALSKTLAERGAFQVPDMTPDEMASSMNGILPEEIEPDEKLQRALYGALRPKYDTDDATFDLRLLAKQGAPMSTLKEIMASMLVVLPTAHMESALHEMQQRTPRWLEAEGVPPSGGRRPGMTPGVLH